MQRTTKSMWKAYFANCQCSTARRLPPHVRLALLDRAVAPVLHHRDTRWPPCRKRANELDRLQRKMVAAILRTQVLPGESTSEYARRRNRQASAQIGANGKWSYKHCQRVLAWEAHLRRPANNESWAARLLGVRSEAWLHERRAMFSRGSQSRIDSRAYFGFVPYTGTRESFARRFMK